MLDPGIQKELKLAAAKYVLRQIPSADLVHLADSMLNRGLFAEGFALMWNLSEPTMSEVTPAFEAALRELHVEMPSIQQAKLLLLESILAPIVEDQVDPVQGLRQFVDWYYRNCEHGNGQHRVATLWALYCLYWSYDELEYLKSARQISPKDYDFELRKLAREVVEAARKGLATIIENERSLLVESRCRT